jgi:hypothetical protein
MPTDTNKWIEINWKVLDTINDNRSIIGSTEGENKLFEKRVGEYSKSAIGVDRSEQSFALDASF